MPKLLEPSEYSEQQLTISASSNAAIDGGSVWEYPTGLAQFSQFMSDMILPSASMVVVPSSAEAVG
jgi:hypothetical protein